MLSIQTDYKDARVHVAPCLQIRGLRPNTGRCLTCVPNYLNTSFANTLFHIFRFNVVPYRRLLHKPDHYGIQGTILNWIQNFLTDRAQK